MSDDIAKPVTPIELAQLKAMLSPPSSAPSLREPQRPVHWKRRTTASYYRERFGVEFKAVIDSMIADPAKGDVVYFYKIYCAPPFGMSKNTLYMRVYQSMKYMLEYLDTPDRKYANIMETIELHREAGVGIRLSFMKDIKLGKPFLPISVHKKDQQADAWRSQLENWLSEDHDIGERLVINKIALTHEEVEELRITLNNRPGIGASVKQDSITISRIPEDEE